MTKSKVTGNLFLIVLTITILFASFKTDDIKVIPDFSLMNVDGKNISTKEFTAVKGMMIIVTCNHCPFAKLYSTRLNQLNEKYKGLGVPLLAINPMDTLIYEEECYNKMVAKAKDSHFNFPYLQDKSQQVARMLGAEHTPTAYLLWKENGEWIIKYKGAIDDNGEKPHLAKPFLANAVDEMLKDNKVSVAETESFGCRIFYRKN